MATKKLSQSSKKTKRSATKKTAVSKRPVRTTATSSKSKATLAKRSRPTKRLMLSNKQIFAIALALVLLMIGATYAYAMHAARQPANVLKQALARTLQADSADVHFKMVDASGMNIQEDSWLMAGPVTAKGVFDLSGSYSKGGESLKLALRSADGKDVYLRADGLSVLPAILGRDAALYGITEQQNPILGLDGEWLTVPANIKDTVLQDQPASGDTDYSLSSSDRQRLARLYEKHEFLRITATYPDDVVIGAPSHHYQVTIDQAAFEAYLRSVQSDVSQLKLSDKRIASLVSSVSEIQSLDVWIATGDNRFSKVSFTSNVGDNKRSVELTATNYDRVVNVSKPIGAKPLLEALTGLRQQ